MEAGAHETWLVKLWLDNEPYLAYHPAGCANTAAGRMDLMVTRRWREDWQRRADAVHAICRDRTVPL